MAISKPVVVVGASMAGLRTIESLRRFGYDGSITCIGDEKYMPYNRPPLSKEVLQSDEVVFESVAFPQRSGSADVNWVLGNGAVSADLARQTVCCANGQVFEYSKLVIASGLRSKRMRFANDIESGRHVIRTLDDAIGLRDELAPGSKVVILGAGFIGCEIAATAKKLGCDVTVVAPSDLPLERVLGQTLSSELMRRQEAEGVRFMMRQTVTDLLGATTVEGVLLGDGTRIECSIFIEAIGSEANTEWLSENDIDIENGVLTDTNLRAKKLSHGTWSNVFAVGDVARFPNKKFDGVARRIEHWNIPTESGKHVGQQIGLEWQVSRSLESEASREAQAALDSQRNAGFTPLPSFWSDQFDVHLLAFGMPAIADSSRLVHGEINGDCVFEYYRGEKVVGVVGIGMRSVVQNYRGVI